MERTQTSGLIRVTVLLCLASVLVVGYCFAGTPPMESEAFTVDRQDIGQKFPIIGSKDRTAKVLSVYRELFVSSYEKAPEIQIARDQKRQKNLQSYTAKAKRFFPAIKGQLSRVHELNYSSSATSASEEDDPIYYDDENYTDWGLSLDLPLFNKPLSVGLEIAEAEELLADNTLRITTQELDLNLKELLGNYLAATYRVFNIRNSVKLSTEHVAKIYRGYELRDQTKLQLLRAQANLTDLETRRDLDEQLQELSFRELLDFSGLDEDDPSFKSLEELLQDEMSIAGCINSLAAIEEYYPKIQHFMEAMESSDLMTFFQDNSLLYEKITLDQKLAGERAQVFTQSEWFDVAVVGQYDRREDTRFSDYDGEGSLSLVFSVPLFTGGTLFSNTKSRAMAEHVAEIQKITDLRVRFHAIENTKKMIESLQKVRDKQQLNLEQQREIVILSFKSYQIKQTSMQDLLTSQNRFIDAKNDLMETNNSLGGLLRRFAWELGQPFPFPDVESKL